MGTNEIASFCIDIFMFAKAGKVGKCPLSSYGVFSYGCFVKDCM